MRLSKVLREQGVGHSIRPTPRHLARSCGIALRFDPALRETVTAAAAAAVVAVTVVEDTPD